jgi:hypothetical protein
MFMKVDCLALGMMSCMKRGLDLLKAHKGIDLDLATIPAEDPRTYAMIRKADTLAVFPIDSRAQMAMLPRIKPRSRAWPSMRLLSVGFGSSPAASNPRCESPQPVDSGQSAWGPSVRF